MNDLPTLSLRDQVVTWMRQNNLNIASFERIVSCVPGAQTITQVRDMFYNNPSTFTSARIKGGLDGLRLSPNATVAPPPVEEQLSVDAITADSPSNEIPLSDLVYRPTPAPTVPVDVVHASPEPVSLEVYVRTLAAKAASADVSGSAENFSKAALNVAQAMYTIAEYNRTFNP